MVDDHANMGWAIFAVLMVPVYFLARRIEMGDSALKKTHERQNENSQVSGVNWLGFIAAVTAMLTGPIWANTISSSGMVANNVQLVFPQGKSDWRGPLENLGGWRPQFAGPSAEGVVNYRSESDLVLVYLNVYLYQEQDSELIYFSNKIEGSWEQLSATEPLSETVTLDGDITMNQLLAKSFQSEWLIWFHYQIGEEFEHDERQAKISQAIEALQGRPISGVVAYAAPCDSNCSEAAKSLRKFVSEIGSSIDMSVVREKE